MLKRLAPVAVSQGADLLELRIDHLPSLPRREDIEWCRELGVPVIVTIRKEVDGGLYRGSEEERIACLRDLATECQMVDLEIESATPELVGSLADAGSTVIVSHHDLRETPPEDQLLSKICRSAELGAEVCKLAAMAGSPEDPSRLLSLLRHPYRLVVIPMGRIGSLARLCAPLLGSEFAYATMDGMPAVAPGMWSIGKMRRLYDEITREESRP